MIRSGIKQGLAVSAVAALATVGLQGAAHAAPSTDVTKISLSSSASTVSAGQTVTYKISATNANGGQATGDLTVALSEPFATGDTVNPFSSSTTAASADSGTQADKTWDNTYTVSLVNGQASLTFASSEAGTVSVNVSNGSSVAASSSVNVVASSNKANDVTSLDASTVPSALYLAEAGSNSVVVTPLVGGNVLAPGATFKVNYTLTGPSGSVPTSGTAGLDYSDASKGAQASIPLSGISEPGNWTLTTWVDQTKNGGTPAKDAGEPSSTTTINVASNPASSYTAQTGGDYKFGATKAIFSSAQLVGSGTGDFPNDTATNVQLTGVLLDGSGKPVANAKVGVDVLVGTASATNKPVRMQATTDAKGTYTVTVPVSAAQAAAADKGVISAAVYVSESANVGDGSTVAATQVVAQSAAPAPQFTIAGATDGVGNVDIQAAGGQTVNVPVKVTDQFGRPVAGVKVNGTISGGNSAATIAQTTTDSTGLATLSYADKSSDDGDIVTVSVAGVAGTQTATIEYVGSLAPARVTIESQPFAKDQTADTAETVATSVQNYYEAKVVNSAGVALVNTDVTVSVDNGFVEDHNNAKNEGASITVKTDANGYVYLDAGSTKAGAQTVTITAGAAAPVQSFKSFYKADSPYGLTVSGALALTTGGQGKVVATVTDEFGNPVKNQWVDFAQSGVGALAGGVSSLEGWTAADGTVSVTVDALKAVGAGKVVVSSFGPVTPDPDATVAASTGDQTVSYTVAAPAVVTPPTKPTPPVKPQPPVVKKNPAITKLKGKSQGKKDVITVRVANDNGGIVKLKSHGKVKTAKVVNGKAVFKVKDKNGAKKTKYTVIVGAVKKALKLK